MTSPERSERGTRCMCASTLMVRPAAPMSAQSCSRAAYLHHQAQSDAIRRNQTQSELLARRVPASSDPIRPNQTQSDAIRRNQSVSCTGRGQRKGRLAH